MIPLSSASSKGLYPPETHSTALTAIRHDLRGKKGRCLGRGLERGRELITFLKGKACQGH